MKLHAWIEKKDQYAIQLSELTNEEYRAVLALVCAQRRDMATSKQASNLLAKKP